MLASLARDRGKAIEPELWSQWGGVPATAMLRAQNPDPDVMDRRRRGQARAGAPLPGRLAQCEDGDSADHEIQVVVNILIKNSRSDAVVLLGVRGPELVCSAVSFAVGAGNLAWTLLIGTTARPLPPSSTRTDLRRSQFR